MRVREIKNVWDVGPGVRNCYLDLDAATACECDIKKEREREFVHAYLSKCDRNSGVRSSKYSGVIALLVQLITLPSVISQNL